MISPLLTVPKKDSPDCPVVMDLSFPHNYSVNDGIPIDLFLGEPFHLHLPGVDSLVHLVQRFGPDSLVFERNISSVYCQFPIDARDYHFLDYCSDDLIFFDTVFAFGLRPATLGCQPPPPQYSLFILPLGISAPSMWTRSKLTGSKLSRFLICLSSFHDPQTNRFC